MFHDDEGDAAQCFLKLENRDDIGMVAAGENLRFFDEGIGVDRGRKNLDGDVPLQGRLGGPEDRSHSACPDPFDDPESIAQVGVEFVHPGNTGRERRISFHL